MSEEKKEQPEEAKEKEANQDAQPEPQVEQKAQEKEVSVVQQAAEKASSEQSEKEEAPKEEEAAKEQPDQPAEEPVKQEPEEVQEPIEHTIRGMIGRKLGMTQIFDKDGNLIPVTVVEAGPCVVLDLKEEPAKVTLGFDPLKENRVNKARQGLFKKIGVDPLRVIREFPAKENKPYKVGQKIRADVFKPGDYVDVVGTSIGKGFQGGMKRHGWSGGPGGHGSMHHRRVGSIGMSADPSRTLKGRTMPGQMGNKRVTTQGLRVMDVDVEKNHLLIKGAVPGCKNGIVSVNLSQKKVWRGLDEVTAVVQHKVNPMKQSKAKAGAKKKGK